MNEAPLSKSNPIADKLRVLSRRLKKADDVARLLEEPYQGEVRAAILAVMQIAYRAK